MVVVMLVVVVAKVTEVVGGMGMGIRMGGSGGKMFVIKYDCDQLFD